MARNKITCPHCNAETYDTPSCGRCGGFLRADGPKKQSKDLVSDFSALLRAETIENNLADVVLATFKTRQIIDDFEFESTELVVEKSKRQFIYTSTANKGVRIGPGKYSMAKIVAAGGGKRVKDLATLICEVTEAPINVTFTFPDKLAYINSVTAYFPEENLTVEAAKKPDQTGDPVVLTRDDIVDTPTGENQATTLRDLLDRLINKKKDKGVTLQLLVSCVQDALNALSLRTADNRLGSALLQLLVRCENPLPLVRCRDSKRYAEGETAFTKEKKEGKEGEAAQRARYIEPSKPLWQRCWEAFAGHEKKKHGILEAKPITMGELYDMIRYELAEAVANAVRDFTVEQLYDRADKNRNRLHDSLKNYMQKSLQGYGLDVLDVVAFQFRSPEYEEFLQKHGDVALRERTFREIEQAEGELFKQKLTYEHGVFEHQQAIEEQQAIIEDNREFSAARRADQLAAEQQDRWLGMDRKRIEFEREQEQKRLELEDKRQYDQAMRALDINERFQEHQMKLVQQAQDADHNRRIAAIDQIAGYPPEQQFLLAMQYNPDLQQAFAAMQHARSNEDKVAMAQQFQGHVQQIYGDQSAQSNALLIEAAKALDLAVGARVQDRAPPLQIKVEHVSGRGSAE